MQAEQEVRTLMCYKGNFQNTTINSEMHERVRMIFFMYYKFNKITPSLFFFFFELFVFVINFWVSFKSPMFAKHSTRSVWLSTCFGLTKQTDCPPLFLIWCSNSALPLCSHGNFRIALYNLYLHSMTYLCIRH